ncbi:MAG: hypothetical protein WC781_05030 [Candidatus Pacearchaeota archaeon]|jgi:hypothetical protein
MAPLIIDTKRERTQITYDKIFPNPNTYEFSYVVIDTSTEPQRLVHMFNENSPENHIRYPDKYVKVSARLAKKILEFISEDA